MMARFNPVVTARDLLTLDPDEIERGYMLYEQGYVLKGDECRSFVHGWRNGHADLYKEPDEYQIALANDVARHKREAGRK